MDPGEQPSWEGPIARFLEFVNDKHCELEIVEPEDSEASTPETTRPFMPLDRVQHYFKDQHFTELRAVLEALFPREAINPTSIFPRYTAVFCTLLCIGRGKWIKYFKHHEALRDTNLPFDPEHLPAHAPPAAGDPSFWHDFCGAQWKFCARVMEDLSDKHIESERILPIISKKRLAGGGSANIWLVEIHPYYNKLITDEAKIRLGKDANIFVLKEYSTADARKYYENETAAFEKVGSNNDNLIKYYGSFIRGNTFNLLLEYADKGTLRRVFDEEDPPTSSENIIQFWEEVFKLINSLSCIHQVEPFAPGGPQIFQGWHQDVKPENILVVSNGKRYPHEWQYKLADLGLSHFKTKTSLREDSTASDTYGTRTYGAPECSRPDLITEKSKLKVKQNIDIWSLGCVYSEVIRWLAQGRVGVIEYRQERKAEIKQGSPVGANDCFHDGSRALDAVRRSHEVSIAQLRRIDFITESVVDIVNDMLVVAEDRPKAQGNQGLWRKQLRTLDNAKRRLADHRRSALSSGLSVNIDERTQPRSQTDPVPGPMPTLPPRLPPNLPPGYKNKFNPLAQSHAQGDPANTPRNSGHGHDNPSFFLEEESFSRLSLEPTVEYINENTSPRHHNTPPNTSQHVSPLTPPSTQPPFFIPNTSQSQDHEVLERPTHLSWNGPERGLQMGTRGSPPTSDSSSPRYSATSSGLASITGSLGHNSGRLGHNSSHHPRSNNINGNLDYRRSTSTFDQQINLVASDFDPQPNATSSINQQYRNEFNQSASPPNPPSSQPARLSYQYSAPEQFVPQPPRPEPQPPRPEPQPSRPEPKKSRSVQEIASSGEMSIEEALNWKRDCKSTKTEAIGINKILRALLYGRDHVFLIDDSYSMAKYWDNVVNVFEALSYIVKGTDNDGLDLFFTISGRSSTRVKETSKLIPQVKGQKRHSQEAKNDIDFRLTEILQPRTERLNKGGFFGIRKPKPLSLYILTDGMWDFEDAAQEPIINAVQKLSDARKGRKEIGIQFISFGNNTDALRRLEHLDRGLGLPTDIVDTEPCDGNVWKMLLGPISGAYDGDPHKSRSPVTTPPEDIAGPSQFPGSVYPR